MSQSDLLSLVRESGQFESDEEADRAIRATLDVDAFLDRVRTEADGRTVELKVRAVLAALVETVPEHERQRAKAQLPDQYASILNLEG